MIRWNVSRAEWEKAEPIRRWIRENDKVLGIALTAMERIKATRQTEMAAQSVVGLVSK